MTSIRPADPNSAIGGWTERGREEWWSAAQIEQRFSGGALHRRWPAAQIEERFAGGS